MEYVCTGATLKCTMGTSCSRLKATPKNVSLTGKDQANIADYVSMKNILGFGRCRSLGYPPTASATAANHGKLTPMPCVPGTCPKWKAIDKDSLLCGEPALLKPATLRCMYGGTISIVNPGQTLEIKIRGVSQQSENEEKIEQEIPEELLQEFNELDTQGLDKESVLNGVQLALDAAGMVPVLGAIPDLINASISVLRGDWVGAGLSIVAAVPGVGDVVGGAKIAYKGAKIAKNVSKARKTGKLTGVEKVHIEQVPNSQYVNTSSRKTINIEEGKVLKNRKTDKLIEDSDNVVKFPTPKSSVSSTSTTTNKISEIEKSKISENKVVRIDSYERKIERVGNGKEKVHIEKKTDITITASVGGGGGVNSSPSGYDKPYNVQSVKSSAGVSDSKQHSSHGGTSHNEQSNIQSKKEPIDKSKYKEEGTKQEELNPNEIESQIQEIQKKTDDIQNEMNKNQPKSYCKLDA